MFFIYNMSVYRYSVNMNFEQLLLSKEVSVNKLSKLSGVARTTILDMVRGRSDIRKASGITLYKIAKSLGITMEKIIELDSPYERDSKTGKPKDLSYYEYSVNDNLAHILHNLKNAIYTKNILQQSYWRDLLLEEITSLRRRDEIGMDSYEYFREKYLGGNND